MHTKAHAGILAGFLLLIMFSTSFLCPPFKTVMSTEKQLGEYTSVPDAPQIHQKAQALGDPSTTHWNKTYGGTANQGPAESAKQTTDGGYIVAGLTNSSRGTGSYDFWLVKTNATGEMQWNRTYGGKGDNRAYSVVQTGDGGYAIAGYTNSSGAGDYDFWVVKTDASGNQEWNRTYGGAGDDEAYSIQQTSDGGYIVAGYTDSSGAGGYDFWLVKTNATGEMQWNRTYGGAPDDYAFSIQQTSDGGYALAGYTGSFGAGKYDFWLVKTDSGGNQEWNRTYGEAGDDEAYSIQQTSDGGYVVAGYTDSSGAGGYDFWLVKTDSGGSQEWNRTYGGLSDDEAYSVVQTSDGGYAIAGTTRSFGAGYKDFWLVKADASGNMQWSQTYGSTLDDEAYSVQQTTDGGFILAGYTLSVYDMEFVTNFWLVKHPALNTLNDYDGLWHTADFTITLVPIGNVTGVETYYKINNDSLTRSVSIDGQPRITSEGANNKLEFWSAYSTGDAEPHKLLTGIKLDKTPPSGSIMINGGAEYTNSTVVTLTFNITSISGAKRVRYRNDDVWDQTPWESFSSNKTWTLAPGDGVKTVYCQIESYAQLNNTLSDTIVLDSTPPTVSLTDPSNGTSVATSSLSFNASVIDAESGVAGVDLYIDGQMKGSMIFISSNAYSLTVSKLADGNHTWYVKATNGARTTTTSSTRSFTVQAVQLSRGNLQIYVKDNNNNPLDEAIIISTAKPSGQQDLMGTTNSSGLVQFNNITAGSYQLRASRSGYQVITKNLTVVAGQTITEIIYLSVSGNKQNNAIWYYYLAAAILIVAVALIGYFLMKKKRQHTQ